jgi:hypothetical protein
VIGRIQVAAGTDIEVTPATVEEVEAEQYAANAVEKASEELREELMVLTVLLQRLKASREQGVRESYRQAQLWDQWRHQPEHHAIQAIPGLSVPAKGRWSIDGLTGETNGMGTKLPLATTRGHAIMQPVGLNVGYQEDTGFFPERLQDAGYASHPAGFKVASRYEVPAMEQPPATADLQSGLQSSALLDGIPVEEGATAASLPCFMQPAGADVFTDAFVRRLETTRRSLLSTLSAQLVRAPNRDGPQVPWEHLLASVAGHSVAGGNLGAAPGAPGCPIPGYGTSTIDQQWKRAGLPAPNGVELGESSGLPGRHSLTPRGQYHQGDGSDEHKLDLTFGGPGHDSAGFASGHDSGFVLMHSTMHMATAQAENLCQAARRREQKRRNRPALELTPPASPPDEVSCFSATLCGCPHCWHAVIV